MEYVTASEVNDAYLREVTLRALAAIRAVCEVEDLVKETRGSTVYELTRLLRIVSTPVVFNPQPSNKEAE